MARTPNATTDVIPSIGHKYNASVIGEYLKKSQIVLDIGCWTGQLYRALTKLPAKYYGIDIPEASGAISEAKKLSPRGHWVVGSALNLPYKSKTFDLVTLLDVIEHIPVGTEKECLEEIYRVLKPGGLLIFSTPADNLVSKLADPAYFLMGHRHYSIPELSKIFQETQFKLIKHWTTGAWWHIVYYWLHLAYKHILHIQGPTFEAQASAELGRPGFLTHYFVVSKSR